MYVFGAGASGENERIKGAQDGAGGAFEGALFSA